VALTDEGDDADEQVHASSPSPPYEGETVDGLSHGQGVMTFQDGKWKGCVYRGHFERGAMSGMGSMTREGVFEYQGEWRENGVEGCKGVMRYLSGKMAGCVYEGAFISTTLRDSAVSLGKRHGHGTMRNATGDVCTCELKAGFSSVRGEIVCSDGVRYVGQWSKGIKGFGVTTLSPVLVEIAPAADIETAQVVCRTKANITTIIADG
jgi:hypothetical protein